MRETIDSRQLLFFVTLADRGSLKAAARELSVTESAISHSLTNLESNLRIDLFCRKGKRLRLTENGQYFLGEASQILGHMGSIRNHLANLSGQGTLRISCGTSFLSTFLRKPFEEFRFSNPRLSMSLNTGTRDECLGRLETGEADLAFFVDDNPSREGLSFDAILEDELQVAMSRNHDLASLDTIPPARLSTTPVYIASTKSFTFQLIEKALMRKNSRLQKITEVPSAETIREILGFNLGVGFQTKLVLRREISNKQLVLRPIEGLQLKRQWYAVYPERSALRFEIQGLITLCRQWKACLETLV